MKLDHLESTHQFDVDDKTGLLTGLSYKSPSGAGNVGFETTLNIQSGGGERRDQNEESVSWTDQNWIAR